MRSFWFFCAFAVLCGCGPQLHEPDGVGGGTGGGGTGGGSTGGGGGGMGGGGATDGGLLEAMSEVDRTTTAAPAGDLAAVAASQRALAWSLYRDLARTVAAPGNLFFSPYSITVALSMAKAGARGATEQAFDAVLGVTLPSPDWHAALNDLDLQLASRGSGASPGAFRLSSANRLFAQQGLPLLPSFLDTLAASYGGGVGLVDFSRAGGEEARELINGWVDQKTEHHIPELLTPGQVSPSTEVVLCNAMFFKASWASQFSPSSTSPQTFHGDTGDRVVPFMHQFVTVRAAQVGGVEVVELPYEGGQMSMVLMMPPEGQLASFEDLLTGAAFEQHLGQLQAERLELGLPKMDLRSSLSLKEPLTRLGLGPAFGGGADFSGLTPGGGLSIADVVHQAVVKVDEQGTEAAAATAVIADGGVAHPPPTARKVDFERPFIFAVVDQATQAVVFAGRYVAP